MKFINEIIDLATFEESFENLEIEKIGLPTKVVLKFFQDWWLLDSEWEGNGFFTEEDYSTLSAELRNTLTITEYDTFGNPITAEIVYYIQKIKITN